MLRRCIEFAARERVRCSAVLLLVCILLPLAQLAAASTQDPEAALPACCRSHGMHKCFMRAKTSRTQQKTSPAFKGASILSERCPCLPATSGSVFHRWSGSILLWNLALPPVAKTAIPIRSQRTLRPSLPSANLKRGPPAFFLALLSPR